MPRHFLKYWLPAIAWIAVIFVASTDLMSAQHTSRFIGPFLRWLVPDITPENVAAVQLVVRKAAHVTEYAILGALLLRAFRGTHPAPLGRHAVLGIAVAITCAAADEYHQSFVATRTGSPVDVSIDAIGAVIGATLCWWLMARGSRRRAVVKRDEAAVSVTTST